MGNQSLSVVAMFVFLNIAVSLCVVSLTSRAWIQGSLKSGSGAERIRKGLWEICNGSSCQRLDQSQQATSFTATQMFFTLGSAMLILSNVLMFVILGSYTLQKNKSPALIKVFGISLALVLLMISQLIYGFDAKNQNLDIPETVEVILGKSFYEGILATAFGFMALLAALRRYQILSVTPKGYRDVTRSMIV